MQTVRARPLEALTSSNPEPPIGGCTTSTPFRPGNAAIAGEQAAATQATSATATTSIHTRPADPTASNDDVGEREFRNKLRTLPPPLALDLHSPHAMPPAHPPQLRNVNRENPIKTMSTTHSLLVRPPCASCACGGAGATART